MLYLLVDVRHMRDGVHVITLLNDAAPSVGSFSVGIRVLIWQPNTSLVVL